MSHKLVPLLFLVLLVSACKVVPLTPPPTPIPTPTPDPVVITFSQQQAREGLNVPVRSVAGSLAALSVTPGPAEMTAPAAPQAVPPEPGASTSETAPYHGFLIAVVLPLMILGIPWAIAEVFVARYVRPQGMDISHVRIKAQDGLFIEATVSMTARKTLTLSAITTRWDQVRSFVEKAVEQELLHKAVEFSNLEELERNLSILAESFIDLPIVTELSRDFGVKVVRFNIEVRYSQETMDALNRKAEASAGGTAYLAFAAAAGLNPDSAECRQLYTVYQETSGQVDAARNLGGGIRNLVGALGQREPDTKVEGTDVASQ